MSTADWEDLLDLAVKGAQCEGGHDGTMYDLDRVVVDKFRAWLREAEISA